MFELKLPVCYRSQEPSEVVLLKRNLLSKEENGNLRASVAGILCCEQPEHFLPNAFIEAVRYRGIMQNFNYQIDAQKIRGTLDQQIKKDVLIFKKKYYNLKINNI